MRTKIHAVMMLAAFVVSPFAQRLAADAPKEGPGPMCFPGFPCVKHLPISVPKDGLPMCFPGYPCVKHLPVDAPQEGPGPMCWPGMPCVNE